MAGISKPLNVALVSTQARWHGGEEQARLLAHGLQARGHRCSILARRGGAFAGRMQDEGFPVVTFSGNARGLRTVWQIRRHLRRIRPDVLHYNDPHALTGAGLASWGLGMPARVVARRVDFPLRSVVRYRWFSDRVVCVSQAVAAVCRECGLPEEQICVVHDGVDPGRACSGDRQRGREALGLCGAEPLVLTVATLTDHKGHRFLLEAVPAVLARHPAARFAWAGDGELAEPLKRRAAELGVDRQVRFLGFRNDVPDLIQACDLFVLPSHMEGLCTTLIDVMLAGRPIVTTTAGGIPDLTGTDEADSEPVAWSVPPRDPRALAAAIVAALDSPEEGVVLAGRAQRRAEQRFTADHMVEATLGVYQELLAENKGRQAEHRGR